MEKKTLGTFLAALRKANGMTQKQLAEMLNVSDKAVSRWERDECAPDLALIPVIAEIFEITADELLRGQRRSADTPQIPKEEKKTEKQLRHLINSTLSRFHIHSIIAGTIAVVGMIAAMICNLGFLRAYLGFFIGLIFYLCAGVCEIIFLILSRGAVKDAELPEALLAAYNRTSLKAARITLGTIAFLFSASLPLIVFPDSPYLGLGFTSWLTYGSLFGGISILFSVLTSWTCQSLKAKKDTSGLSAADSARMKLRRKTLRIALIVLCATLLCHWGFNQFTSSTTFVKGTTFDEVADFKLFMETPKGSGGEDVTVAWDGPAGTPDAHMVYICEDGSVIVPEDIPKESLYGSNGELLCEYHPLNMSVCEIEYTDVITVYTETDRIHGYNIKENIHSVFILLYFLEIAIIVVSYLIRNKKIR